MTRKPKSREAISIVKKLQQPLVIVVSLICVLSILFVFNEALIQNRVNSQNDALKELLVNYVIGISSSILVCIVLYLSWNTIMSILNMDKEDTPISKMYEGLCQADGHFVFTKAADYVKNAGYIRVIGTVRKDQWGDDASESIDMYLQNTITRLSEKEHINYSRISSFNSFKDNIYFDNHLSEVFSIGCHNRHKIEMMSLDDFTPVYTYLIIDTEFLMLNLNSTGGDKGVIKKSFFSENPTIINQFIKHFDNVWHEEREKRIIFKTEEEYNLYRNEENRIIEDYLAEIRTYSYQFSIQNRLYKQHISRELEELANRFKNLKNNSIIEISHRNHPSSLTGLFVIYIKQLQKGDSFEAVSFHGFWNQVLQQDINNEFIKENINALEKGAKIIRTFIIVFNNLDWTKSNMKNLISGEICIYPKHSDLIKDTYEDQVRKMLNANLPLLNKPYDDYEVRIHFVSSEDKIKYRRIFNNFAMLKKGEAETVMFEPDLPEGESKTMIHYHKGKERKHKHITDKEGHLIEIKTKWNNQKIEEPMIRFLNNLDFDYFDFRDSGKDKNFINILGSNAKAVLMRMRGNHGKIGTD